MLNTTIKWVTMTYFLCGTVVCVSLYLLERFTTVNVIEQESIFTKSPNAILKTVPITMVSSMIGELSPNEGGDFGMKQRESDLDENIHCCSDVSKANDILSLSEIVNEATKVTIIDQNSPIQKNSDN